MSKADGNNITIEKEGQYIETISRSRFALAPTQPTEKQDSKILQLVKLRTETETEKTDLNNIVTDNDEEGNNRYRQVAPVNKEESDQEVTATETCNTCSSTSVETSKITEKENEEDDETEELVIGLIVYHKIERIDDIDTRNKVKTCIRFFRKDTNLMKTYLNRSSICPASRCCSIAKVRK